VKIEVDINKPLPEIIIAGELFCPHCGNRLFSWEDSLISKCPHLIFAYGWNEDDMFLAVRSNFAHSFMNALLESKTYRECLIEDEMEPISKQDRETFCRADFDPDDRIAYLIASYCSNLPEKMFPSILSQSTVIFIDDRPHSGVHIALDSGVLD